MTAAFRITDTVDWTVQQPDSAKFTQHTATVDGFTVRVRQWHGADRNHWTVSRPRPESSAMEIVAKGTSVEIHSAMAAAIACARNGGVK